jgi:hypothetical protein
MIKLIISIILLVISMGLFYDAYVNKNIYSIIFFVVVLISVGVILLYATISHFFPNSKIKKFVEKMSEWIRDGLQGL